MATIALALLAGCSRKAPGPEECHEFALAWARAQAPRMRDSFGRSRAVVSERDIVERTRVCLTTPFDRQLIRCQKEGGSPTWCLERFKARLRTHRRSNR